jgi:iron complex outermembrane receptor protein
MSADTSAEAKPPSLADLSLEALMEIEVPKVYGASKFEQRITEAPSSVTVVNADQIKRFGYRTLADILRSVPGFHVSYDRNYAFLGARGIDLGDFNSRVLLLVDSHRVNNNLTDGAFIDTAAILDVDLIDRVEIIRGPGSALYGNNAFFGVINVVTRTGKQLQGAEVSGEYGGFDTYKGRATYGKLFPNGVQLLVSGTYYQSEGADRLFYEEYNTPAQNNGVAEGLDDDTFASFFATLSYADFTLQGAFNRREKGNPTAQYLTTFNDARLRTTDERSYVNLKYAHSFPDVVDVVAQVYYDHNGYEIGYPLGSPVATSFFEEHQTGEWWGAELQFNKRVWERHLITLGAEYRDDFQQNQRVADPATGEIYTDVQQNRQSYGVFLQGDFAVVTNLHFSAGARYDQYGDFDPAFNPRLALIYHPLDGSTIKVLYGTAFRAPNFLELSDPRFQDISPEEITTYELVYEQEIIKPLRSSVSLYYNRMDDLIVFQSGSFTNLDVDCRGLELALEGSWLNGIRCRASYAMQHSENRSFKADLSDSPEHLVKASLSVPLMKEKIFAGLEYHYTSGRHTYYTTTTGETLPGANAADFGVFNLTLFSQNLLKNLDCSASIYNLLDCEFDDPASRFHIQDTLASDGRSFRFKLTYRF